MHNSDEEMLEDYRKSQVSQLTINAALGYFIFGYANTIFTSSQQCVSSILHWDGNSELYIAISSALIPLGALFGVFIATYFSKLYDRRINIMITDVFTIISSIVIILPLPMTFWIGRLLSGIYIGSYSYLCPKYINEYTPKEIRGEMGALNQLLLLIGILFSFSICLPLPVGDCNEDLRYYVLSIFCFPGIVALLQYILFYFKYYQENSDWLIKNPRKQSALVSDISQDLIYLEYHETVNSSDTQEKLNEDTLKDMVCCKKNTRKATRVSVLYHILSQFSGINGMLAYLTSIFTDFGEGVFMSRVYTIIFTLSRIIVVFLLLNLVEKHGVKMMSIYGEVILGSCAILIYIVINFTNIPILLLILVDIYLIVFGVSIGSIVWIISSELVNDTGMALCTSINWICAFIVVLFFPLLAYAIGWSNLFMLIGVIDLFGAMYFYCDIIETKGLSLDEIKEKYINK